MMADEYSDQVFELINEGGQDLELFAEAGQQEVDDLMNFLSKWGMEGQVDLDKFEEMRDDPQLADQLGYYDRIKDYDWFQDVLNISDEEIIKYHPDFPEGKSLAGSEFGIRRNEVGTQQYENLVRLLDVKLEDSGLGTDYRLTSGYYEGNDMQRLLSIVPNQYAGKLGERQRILRYQDLIDKY
jgi:hypothetical protein